MYRPIASCRKRKLEIHTEQYILAAPCQQPSPIAPSPLTLNDTSNPGGSPSYYERRGSITSSGTESTSSSEGSPVMTHFSSPRVSLPSPQQSYDKMFASTSCYSTLLYPSPPQLPVTSFDPTAKLPPIRNLFSFKKQKTTEEDAVLAMMQLSQDSPQRFF